MSVMPQLRPGHAVRLERQDLSRVRGREEANSVKRRLFNAAAVVSLLICVAVAGLWLWSQWRSDSLVTGSPSLTLIAGSSRRGIGLTITQIATPLPRGWSTYPPAVLPRAAEAWTDFRASTQRVIVPGRGAYRQVSLHAPHWSVLVLFAIPPLAAWALRRRKLQGLVPCPACGYDLRGSEGATCPECGAARETKAA